MSVLLVFHSQRLDCMIYNLIKPHSYACTFGKTLSQNVKHLSVKGIDAEKSSGQYMN